jgi:ABC-2 type transport system permease protein
MTTTILPTRVGAFRASNVVRSEWTKLRTVNSTWWLLGSVLVGTVAIGILVSAAVAARWDTMSAADRIGFDPTFRSLTGLFFAQLAVGVLGVLAITSEYGSGMIRSTLAAVPRRRAVLAGKSLAVAVSVLAVGTAACVAAFLAGQAIFSTKGIGVSLGAPGELGAVLGGGLYLAALALLALGLGGIFRHTAAAIFGFVLLVLVLPYLVSPLPAPFGRDIAQYLPSEAGQAILNVHTTANSLPPWTGFGVLCAWTVLALGAAAWLITRRDV